MHDLPLVSVILPCYNSQAFIDNCLKSLINQTYKNLEIIAVDDFSTDDTFKILSFYAQKYSYFKAIHSNKKGVSCARNLAIDLAKGEYITFIDSDDFISPFHIENLVNSALKENADAVVCGYKKVKENTKFSLQKFKKNTAFKVETYNGLCALKQYLCQKKFEYSVWNKLYKAEIIRKYSIRFNEDCCYNEDSFFNYSFFKYAKKTLLISCKTYFYVQRKQSLVHRPFNSTKFTAFLSLNGVIKDAYENLPDVINYAHVLRITICCELLFYIKFLKCDGKTFDNGAVISKIIEYISIDRKFLKFCKEAHLYRRLLMPLVPPVAKILLVKRRKKSGELFPPFYITDK